jgi:hypothetical protein
VQELQRVDALAVGGGCLEEHNAFESIRHLM